MLHQSRQVKDLAITDVIGTSIQQIKFGTVIPGNIFEDDLEIQSKIPENLVLKIVVQCHNKEFDDHDEYVFSVRKTVNYDYNEKFALILQPHKTHLFKIALKVPNVKQPNALKGSVVISVQGIDSHITIPISATVEIPSLICTKELFNIEQGLQVIKLAVKKGKKPDCKIPFKNCSNINLALEAEWLQDETPCPYNFLIHPPQLSVTAKNMFIMTLLMKQSAPQGDPLGEPSVDKNMSIHKVLLLKIKNSNIIFSFPVIIEVFD